MRRLFSLVLVSMTIMGLNVPLAAGAQELGRRLGGANGPPAAEVDPDRPVPMLSDGTVDLSGVWTGGGSGTIEGLLQPDELDGIMLPWARERYASRDPGQDPYNYCMPGGPLRMTGGFAWRFVQHPTTNSTHIFMLQEGNAHTYRQIFMDGREHPRIRGRPGTGTRSDGGKGKRWSSTRSASTTSSGSIAAAPRIPSSCT